MITSIVFKHSELLSQSKSCVLTPLCNKLVNNKATNGTSNTQILRRSSQVTTAASSTGPNFTKTQAVQMIERLSTEERKLFLKELKKFDLCLSSATSQPTKSELRKLTFHNSLPFIGFGFLDNFIMIVAGEYIDLQLGMTLGISTMAAAALGNTISDVCGIGSAWYVEMWAAKLGAEPPKLSPTQLELPSCKAAVNTGRAVGVVIGCLLGMIPLLFIDTKQKLDEEAVEDQNSGAEKT